MYLDGLNGVTVIPGVEYNSCLAMRGAYTSDHPSSPRAGVTDYYASGKFTVVTQDAVQQAPATITVSVPTTTTVSPQISPNLIQQQQPTNSPVGATTSQATAPNAGQASYDAFMKQLADQQAAQQKSESDSQKAILDLLAKQSNQLSPAQQGAPVTVSVTGAEGSPAPDPNAIPPQVSIPTPVGPFSLSESSFTKALPILALAVIGFLVIRSKKQNTRKR